MQAAEATDQASRERMRFWASSAADEGGAWRRGGKEGGRTRVLRAAMLYLVAGAGEEGSAGVQRVSGQIVWRVGRSDGVAVRRRGRYDGGRSGK